MVGAFVNVEDIPTLLKQFSIVSSGKDPNHLTRLSNLSAVSSSSVYEQGLHKKQALLVLLDVIWGASS